MSVTPAEVRTNMKANTETAFAKWMDKPETKLMLSLIPPSENPDAMQTLLRSCFAEGHGAGEGAVAMMFLEKMLAPRPNDDKREDRGPFGRQW